MDKHKDYYTDAEKVNILADSMDDEVARQIVLDNYSSGMTTALEELQAAYGRKSVIYPLLIEDLLKREKIDYTADGMRNAIDRTKKILEDMERIDGKDIEFLTVAMAIRDFDSETRTEWLKQLSSADELPTLEKFLEFVTPLSRNLPRRSKSSQHKFQGSKQQYQGNNYHGNNHHSSKEATNSTTTKASTIALEVKQEATTPSKKKPCPICKEEKSHPTYRCKKFKEGTVPQRLQWVKQYKLCPNCLHNSHQKVEDCTSTYTCRHCHEKHNYLLHQGSPGISLATTVEDSGTKLPAGFIHTALVTLQNNGAKITARAALDSCSSHSLITEAMASYLDLKRESLDLVMAGAVAQQKIKHCAKVKVSTVIPSSTVIPIDVAISPTLPSANPPTNPEEIAKKDLVKGLSLADPYLGGKIDIIIVTVDMPLFLEEDNNRRFSAKERLTAISTIYGWTLSGPSAATGKNGVAMKVELQQNPDTELFQQMYQLEQVPQANTWTPQEQAAVEQFNASVQQHSDGRYSCKLPRVEDPPKLGDSKQMAKARFLQNERRMKRLGHLEAFN